MTYNIKTGKEKKNGKEKILRIWITIIRHGGSIKCDSLALRT